MRVSTYKILERGILSGIMTPTEAGGLGALLSLILAACKDNRLEEPRQLSVIEKVVLN